MFDVFEWKDSHSAKYVLEWAEKSYAEALTRSVREQAEEVGRKAKEEFWKESNPDDGVGCPSSNPYKDDRERGLQRIKDANNTVIMWGKILEFLRDRVCNLIEDKVN